MSTTIETMPTDVSVLRLKPQLIESDYRHHPSELVKGGVSKTPVSHARNNNGI
jgi:hypothetical protein